MGLRENSAENGHAWSDVSCVLTVTRQASKRLPFCTKTEVL